VVGWRVEEQITSEVRVITGLHAVIYTREAEAALSSATCSDLRRLTPEAAG
jgi:hypothetical protein